VRVQLPWAHQAQFAGYLAAIEQGYYEAAGIEVTIVEGGPDVDPVVVGSAPDGPEFTVAWVPSVLEARAGGGSDLVDIAQILQRSGSLSVSRKASDVTRAVDFRDQKVGVLGAGRDLEVLAGAVRAGLVPGTDFTVVTQGPTIKQFLERQLDVAQATVYNEYAQVLEALNPATGALYQPIDLNVINWNDEGTAMLQDAVVARASWLADDANEGLARDFLQATFQGWMFCRDDPDECVRYTVDAGAAQGAGHQAWMMNEINGLIWPSPGGIGVLDEAAWEATVSTLVETDLIPTAPPTGAYRTDLAEAALAGLADFDTTGESFVKRDVPITPGGR
jgi:NitT/TauT family transport system substrate-binding protein